MKKCFLLFNSLLCISAAAWAQPARHVVLISIDGLRPEFYQDPSWPAPNLQRIKKEGVAAAQVQSVFPSVTYPAHTTMVTGALPARHGIYYNVPFGAKKEHWYWEESYIKVPTLWDAVKQAGLTSAAVMWPVTVGAPIDYNFPVRRADGDENTDQLTVTTPYVTPSGLIDEIQKNKTGKLSKQHFNHDHVDGTIGDMASYIFKTYQPNLMAVHFLGVDHESHAEGREGPKVKRAVAVVDSMVGILIETIAQAGLKSSTTVIITGDHGFVNSDRIFSPNVLLEKNGLLAEQDWQARFHSAGGASFLYLKNKEDLVTLTKVKQLLTSLPEAQQQLFRVVDRAELDAIGANPEVAMALAMSKGVVAGNDASGELVRKKKKNGSHGYFPDFDEIHTGFIAAGAGMDKNKQVAQMGIKDIAPLIAALLNLPFNAPDGKVPSGIIVSQKKK